MKFTQCIKEESILSALHKLGWDELTPVQEQVMPLWSKPENVVAQAQTGSGKTGAYLLPVLERIDWTENAPQCFILVPTRELAKQVKADVEALGKYKRIQCVALIGKEPMAFQIQDLKQKCHVVVATPGRAWEHLQQGSLLFHALTDVVLDEADEMCRMGFLTTVQEIFNRLPQRCHVCLCSATLSNDVEQLSQQYAAPYTKIIVERTLWKQNTQSIGYEITDREKSAFLWKLLLYEAPAAAIIFCNTRAACEQLYRELYGRGLSLSLLHGAMDQSQREQQWDRFRLGKTQVLITTDIAARGLDLTQAAVIINYDLPTENERFVHRAGRSGRYHHAGRVISLFTAADRKRKAELEDYCQQAMEAKDSDVIRAQEDDENTRCQFFSKRKEQEEKSAVFRDDTLRLYIHGGKNKKIRAKDIVGALCQIEDIDFADIGAIQIQDWRSYVEIYHGKGERAKDGLNQATIKKHRLKVEISRKQ